MQFTLRIKDAGSEEPTLIVRMSDYHKHIPCISNGMRDQPGVASDNIYKEKV
jgi:hypothetical protein